jgi:hypothetical protein
VGQIVQAEGCAMTHIDRPELGVLAKLVIVVAIVLIFTGLLWHGIAFARFWHDLVDRTTGPMKFRLIMQPSIAAIFAIHHGLKAVRAGRSPYFSMMVLRNPKEHVGRMREGLNVGLNVTAKIIVVALVLDTIYQVVALGTFYPFEALVVALLLAYVPYMITRGLVVRALRRRTSAQPAR